MKSRVIIVREWCSCSNDFDINIFEFLTFDFVNFLVELVIDYVIFWTRCVVPWFTMVYLSIIHEVHELPTHTHIHQFMFLSYLAVFVLTINSELWWRGRWRRARFKKVISLLFCYILNGILWWEIADFEVWV